MKKADRELREQIARSLYAEMGVKWVAWHEVSKSGQQQFLTYADRLLKDFEVTPRGTDHPQ